MITLHYLPKLLQIALFLLFASSHVSESFVPSRRTIKRIKGSATKIGKSSFSSLHAMTEIASQQLGTFERLNVDDENKQRSVILYDFSSQNPIKYDEMWDMQKKLVNCHLHRLATSPSPPQFLSDEDCFASIKNTDNLFSPSQVIQQVENAQLQQDDQPSNHFQKDAIIMLQHAPVYTLGTASDPSFITSVENDDVDIVRIERGGEVTCHAPGQLVVYPILDLRGYKQDIHWYMRALEECIIVALEKAGIEGATREDDLTGVWVQNKKIAALGIKVRRWVTMHGLAINIEQKSLPYFDGIVPCGLVGRDVTCVNDHLDVPLSVEEFGVYMKEALEEIFEISLVGFR